MTRKRGRNPIIRRRGNQIFTTPQTSNHENKFNGDDFDMLDYLNKLQEEAKANGCVGDGDPKNTGQGFSHPQAVPQEDFWESGIEIIKSCGSAPERVPVTVGPLAMAKINALMAEYPKIEWLAYLIGEGQHVSDIVVPTQEVTPVNVFVGQEGVSVPTIGVIHSHHGMGNGFSGTDHEYINGNHDISLCISHGGIAGQVRVKTSCNKYVIVQATVSVVLEGFDGQSFIEEAKTLIKPKTYTPRTGQNLGCHSNIHNLGIDDLDNSEEDFFLGIVDLANTFEKDVEDFPMTFDTIDLVGYKEMLSEVVNPNGNYDRFADLYGNFLDNNDLYPDEETGDWLNPAIDLLDEIDTKWGEQTQQERQAIINLFKQLKEAIELHIADAEENKETIDENPVQAQLPTDEELWKTEPTEEDDKDSWNTEEPNTDGSGENNISTH